MAKLQRKKKRRRAKRQQKNKSKNAQRAIVKREPLSIPEAIEQVLIAGDLTALLPQQRIDYYNRVCRSLGLNPLTRPFDYIMFRATDDAPAKLQLYANKDCGAQLRSIHGVSVFDLETETNEDYAIAKVKLRDRNGKVDVATGMVSLTGWSKKDSRPYKLTGTNYANAIMKAETKAKRRGTLSICGLAFLDESEIEGMQIVGGVTKDGRIFEYQQPDVPRIGSREAAQDVLEKKLKGEMPLHSADETKTLPASPVSREPGNTTGAAKSKEREKPSAPSQQPPISTAPASTEGVPGAAWKKETEKKADAPPKKIPESEYHPENVPPPVKPPEWKFDGSITFDITRPDTVIVTGDVQNLFAKAPQCMSAFQWGNTDSLWHVKLADTQFIAKLCVEINFEVRWIEPTKKSSAPQRHAGSGKPTAKGGAARGSSEPAVPAVVHGTIERVNAGMAGKYPVRQVTVVLPDSTKPTYACFDKDLFEDLDKGLGKPASFILKRNKDYFNIVGLKQIGSQEYDEDGKTKVIQQKDREAGGRTLFP